MTTPESTKTPKKRRILFLVLLSLLLVGSLGINYMLLNKSKEIVTVIKHKTDTLVVVKNNLGDIVKQKIAELEIFKGKNKALDEVIAQGKDKLNQLEAEATSLSASAGADEQKNKVLAAKLAELDKTSKIFLEQINQLLSQNKTLKKKNDSISTDLHMTNFDNDDLKEKVNLGSSIRVEYVKISPMKKKLLGKSMETTYSAWLVTQIQTCFRLMDNSLAKPGQKVISLRIVNPSGKVLRNTVSGAGTFKNAAGEVIQYTGNKTVNYTGAKSDQCMDYDTPSNVAFVAGTYRVEIYVDGVLGGSGTVELK